MLSLCKQIIWEWEVSQGRDGTPSKVMDEAAPKVLKDALVKCGISPGEGENVKVLDRVLELLHAESCYEDG